MHFFSVVVTVVVWSITPMEIDTHVWTHALISCRRLACSYRYLNISSTVCFDGMKRHFLPSFSGICFSRRIEQYKTCRAHIGCALNMEMIPNKRERRQQPAAHTQRHLVDSNQLHYLCFVINVIHDFYFYFFSFLFCWRFLPTTMPFFNSFACVHSM